MTFSIEQIWRYPVKSFEGEQIDSALLSHNGIPFDRHWAIRDVETMRALVTNTSQRLGVSAEVLNTGFISVGDSVTLS